MITANQLKDVLERTDALNRYLNIDQKKIEFEEEQLRTQAPDFWEDPKRAEEQMKLVKSIEKWIKGYNECKQYTANIIACVRVCASCVVLGRGLAVCACATVI